MLFQELFTEFKYNKAEYRKCKLGLIATGNFEGTQHIRMQSEKGQVRDETLLTRDCLG